MTNERFGFAPEESSQIETESSTAQGERIENNMWRPGIFDEYKDEVAAAASTKLLRRTEDVALRILGDQKRFTDRPMKERVRAGRILAELRNTIDENVDLHNIVKSQLANAGNIHKVDEKFVEDLVKGNLQNKQILKTDGLITNLKGYPLFVSAADCAPVGVYDPDNKAIGAFHNGIYGLVHGVSENGVSAMVEQYNSKPENLKVTIGPGISGDGYELDERDLGPIKEKFGEEFVYEFVKPGNRPGLIFFNISGAIRKRLIALGLRPENIEVSQYTTDKNNDLFPSSRTEDKIVGAANRDNFGFMIVLK